MTEVYDNAETVVEVMVPVIEGDRVGLMLVRRADNGKLAIPGGFQMRETWQAAGARELFEETNLVVQPEELELVHVETTPNGFRNLLFCMAKDKPIQSVANNFRPQEGESIEYEIVWKPVETAFPIHDRLVRWFFMGGKI